MDAPKKRPPGSPVHSFWQWQPSRHLHRPKEKGVPVEVSNDVFEAEPMDVSGHMGLIWDYNGLYYIISGYGEIPYLTIWHMVRYGISPCG